MEGLFLDLTSSLVSEIEDINVSDPELEGRKFSNIDGDDFKLSDRLVLSRCRRTFKEIILNVSKEIC